MITVSLCESLDHRRIQIYTEQYAQCLDPHCRDAAFPMYVPDFTEDKIVIVTIAIQMLGNCEYTPESGPL